MCLLDALEAFRPETDSEMLIARAIPRLPSPAHMLPRPPREKTYRPWRAYTV